MKTLKEITIFKTLEIGALPVGGLLSELSKEGCYVSSFAKDLMEKMPLSRIEKVDLCKMTLAEMGFTKSATWAQILERVRELGDVCPPEVGPLMRLADTEQKKGDWYWVAMELISDSDGDPSVFCVERGDDGLRWLRGSWVNPGRKWNLVSEIVFRLRKSSALEPKPSLDPVPFELPKKLVINGVEYTRI